MRPALLSPRGFPNLPPGEVLFPLFGPMTPDPSARLAGMELELESPGRHLQPTRRLADSKRPVGVHADGGVCGTLLLTIFLRTMGVRVPLFLVITLRTWGHDVCVLVQTLLVIQWARV